MLNVAEAVILKVPVITYVPGAIDFGVFAAFWMSW
jgi:hypothetical protein